MGHGTDHDDVRSLTVAALIPAVLRSPDRNGGVATRIVSHCQGCRGGLSHLWIDSRLITILTFLALCAHFSISAQAQNTWPLTKAGKPACTVVVVTTKEPDLLMQKAQESITSTVRRWSGADLPVAELKESTASLTPGPAIVLTTLERLRTVAPEIETSSGVAKRIAFTGDQGFACVPIESRGAWRMFVVGHTPRGVFNGAIYLRDFLIDGEKDHLYLRGQSTIRSPQMEGRPVYLLTIWGNEDEYTVQDWMTVFDNFARDGMDRVYFWLSGHFPSQKFPQTYKVADKLKGLTYDSTKDSGIPTLEDQRRLIRYAHDMGLKFYLGGALGGSALCSSQTLNQILLRSTAPVMQAWINPRNLSALLIPRSARR